MVIIQNTQGIEYLSGVGIHNVFCFRNLMHWMVLENYSRTKFVCDTPFQFKFYSVNPVFKEKMDIDVLVTLASGYI